MLCKQSLAYRQADRHVSTHAYTMPSLGRHPKETQAQQYM